MNEDRAKTVYMFPGQGSQYVGMLGVLEPLSPAQRALCEVAGGVVGYDLVELIEQGPEARLTHTAQAQPALLLAGLLAARARDEAGEEADVVLGHSLGDFTALAHAGAVAVEDALRLVKLRGELMAEASSHTPGTMIAVLNPNLDQLWAIVSTVAVHGALEIANYNGPTQVVLSGELRAVEEARKVIERGHAGHVRPLEVEAPFHTSLMRPVVEAFSETLERVDLQPPRVPYVSSTTGTVEDDPARIRELLVEQLTRPVLWEQAVRTALGLGGRAFFECGPRQILTKLVRRIAPDARIESTDPA